MIIIAGLRGKRPIGDGELVDIVPRAKAQTIIRSERSAISLATHEISRVRIERRKSLNISYTKAITDGIST